MANNSIQKTDMAARSMELEAPKTGEHVPIARPLAATQRYSGQSGQTPQKIPSLMQKPSEQPLSQMAHDPLVPEDDIASFFRNRGTAQDTETGLAHSLTKTLGIFSLISLAFICTYNQKKKFADAVDRKAEKYFGIKMGSYIPAFGARAKQRDSTHTEDIRRSVGKGTGPLSDKEIGLDPIVILIRNGQWSEAEHRIGDKCMRWSATTDCAYKGLFAAHRGMVQTSRPMLLIPDAEVSKLKPNIQTYWYVSTAVSAPDPSSRMNHFQLALKSAHGLDFKKFVVDEMIVGLAKINLFAEIPKYLTLIGSDESNPSWQASVIKWRALASLSYAPNARQAALHNLVKADRGSLRYDLQSIAIFAPAMIRAGLAAPFSIICGDALASANTTQTAPELMRGLMQSSVRARIALGQRAEAATVLGKYTTAFGKDAFDIHYSAVIQLAAGGPERSLAVTKDLRGLKLDAPWETLTLYAFALLKSGQSNKIDPYIAAISANKSAPNARIWATILRGEKLLADHKSREAEQLMRPLFSGLPNHIFVGEVVVRAYQALGQDHDAASLRAKLDDARAKTSYWSSPEMLNSPFGPLALAR